MAAIGQDTQGYPDEIRLFFGLSVKITNPVLPPPASGGGRRAGDRRVGVYRRDKTRHSDRHQQPARIWRCAHSHCQCRCRNPHCQPNHQCERNNRRRRYHQRHPPEHNSEAYQRTSCRALHFRRQEVHNQEITLFADI